MQDGLLLLDLRQRVPVIEKQILKCKSGVVAARAVRAPEAEQAEGLAAGADAAVHDIGVTQSEVARVEDFLWPPGANCVRNTGREFAVFDQNIVDVVAGTHPVGLGVAVPVALNRQIVVGGAQKGVADHGVAAAQPVHAVLVGVSGVAANHAQIVVGKSGGILHLDGPGARANDAGQAIDLDVVRLIGADAMPVGLLHPALVGSRVLRALVDDDAAPQHLHVFNLPEVQAAEDVRAGFEIDGIAALRIEAFAMHARRHNEDVWPGGRRRGGRAGKEKQHFGVIQKVARPGDGNLGRAREAEADGAAVARSAQTKPPRLDIDAAIPKTGFRGSNRDLDGSGGIEAHEAVIRSRAGHVHALPVYGDGEEAGAHFRGNWRGPDARSGMGDGGKRENGNQQRAKNRQEEPLRQNCSCFVRMGKELLTLGRRAIFGRFSNSCEVSKGV